MSKEFFFESDTCVTCGIGETSPVRVGAIPGCFHEQGVADGACDFLGVRFGLAAFDDELDELGDFLAIADDLLGQRIADEVDCFFEGEEQVGKRPWLDAGLSVGKEEHGVVGAHVAVDGDAVEGLVAGDGQHVLELFAVGDASVVMKASMVAMFGSIMPAPLAMPETVMVLPSNSNWAVATLRRVSEVRMASAALSEDCGVGR